MIWSWLSRRPLLVDVTLVGLLLCVAIVTAVARGDGVTADRRSASAETLPLLCAAPAAASLVLAVVTAVALVMIAAGDWMLPFQLGLALYTLASFRDAARAGGVVGAARSPRSRVAVLSPASFEFGDSLRGSSS